MVVIVVGVVVEASSCNSRSSSCCYCCSCSCSSGGGVIKNKTLSCNNSSNIENMFCTVTDKPTPSLYN